MVKLLDFLDRHTARHLFRSSHLKYENWPDKYKFTLPTPPMQQNCQAENFPISHELFRLSSAKVPQRYQEQKDYCF